MGIDFNNLIKNLGKVASSMQNDKSKLDFKTELNTYVSGWDAIKAQAESENSKVEKGQSLPNNIEELEQVMKSELKEIMVADFAKKATGSNNENEATPLFSEEEISLENLMAHLAPEDGLDIEKLREQNKKPLLSSIGQEIDSMRSMNEFGFDPALTNIIMDKTPGAIKYISDAINSGRADAIAANFAEFGENSNIAITLFALRDDLV